MQYASICAGALLLLPVALYAQAPQTLGPKPTPEIDRMLGDALKIKDPTQQIQSLNRVLDAAKAANALDGQAIALKSLGNCYRALGQLDTALGYYNQALPISLKAGKEDTVARVWISIADASLDLGQPQKASNGYLQALQALKIVGNKLLEGHALCNLGKATNVLGQPLKALDYLNEAVPVLREVGDLTTLGQTLEIIGFFNFNLGHTQKALDFMIQARRVEQEIGNRQAEAEIISNIGIAYFNLGQSRKALEYLLQALSIQRKLGIRRLEENTLGTIGVAYFNLGQSQKALTYDSLALQIAGEIGDRGSEARLLEGLGNIYDALTQVQRALDYYNQALAIERASGDKGAMVLTLGDTASAYVHLLQPKRALDYYDQALRLSKELGDIHSSAKILANMAGLYEELGQHQTALDYYKQALPLEEEVGDRRIVAHTLGDMGATFASLGQSKEALDHLQQAHQISRELGDKTVLAKSLAQLGAFYGSQEQFRQAQDYLSQAIPLTRELGDRVGEANVLDNLSVLYAGLKQYRKALTYFNQSLAITREVGEQPLEARALDNASYLLGLDKLPGLAIVFAKQSVNTYQDIRKRFRGLPKSDQDAYAKMVEPAYRHLADLLIKQGRLREAEKVMNLLKDEENFEFVARDAAVVGGVESHIESIGAEAGWWATYQKLQDKALKIDTDEFDLTQKAAKLRSLQALNREQESDLTKIEANLKAIEAQKDVLDKAADAYFQEVGKAATALGQSIRKEAEVRVRQTGDDLPLLLARVHRTTAESVGAVYALASTDELDFLIVTYAGRAHVSVPIKSEDLNKLISEFRKHLMNPFDDPRPSGEKLYHLVFEKVIRQLREAGCTRVVWCMDGTLRYVPIGALWDGTRYLIERGDFTMFDPLNLDRMSAESSKRPLAAGFAATEGKGVSFAPLPGADRELKSVVRDDSQAGFSGAVRGRAWENKGFDAKNLTLAMKGSQYSLLHIATHFNVGKDFNSSDLLLGDGSLLSLKQFNDAGARGRLGHLDLVCLSACDTAETFGDSVSAGSELSSFASLTLRDGASSVVASLWPVSDASTPLVMKRFHESWMAHKGDGKAEALRRAQLSLLLGETATASGQERSEVANAPKAGDKPYVNDPKRPFAHPYYWAPFILFGNWN